jgi:ribosomal protein S12 methylthiotransferase accessory factor YcaO
VALQQLMTASPPDRSDKGFTLGTHRACSPAETWERIRPHFAATGLTRNADITGLDRIGIPVTLAFRPDAPTMANSTGKGLTLEAALVSGAMGKEEFPCRVAWVIMPELEGYLFDGWTPDHQKRADELIRQSVCR